MLDVIVALDTDDAEHAIALSRVIDAAWYKIGLELALTSGSHIVHCLRDEGRKVFLDLKLRDIPTTIERSVSVISRKWRPNMLTVSNNIDAALRGCGDMLIIEVPTLTSDDHAAPAPVKAHGVVCRPSLARSYRDGGAAIIITPGVRLPGHALDDHVERAAPPPEADYIVVGRPITTARRPREAYEQFLPT